MPARWKINGKLWLFRREEWGGILFNRTNGRYCKVTLQGTSSILKAISGVLLSEEENKFIKYLSDDEILIFSEYQNNKDSQNVLSTNKRIISLPLEILFYVTTACNRRCPFCYLPEYRQEEMVTSSVVDAFITQLHQYPIPVVAILGGEPFLFDRLPDLVSRLLDETNSRISISTNGLLDYPDIWSIASSATKGVIGFNVSFHAVHPISNDNFKISKSDIYAKQHFIERLAAYQIPFGISTVVHKGNIFQLEDIAKWITQTFSGSTLQDWTLAYMHPIGSALSSPKLTMSLSEAVKWQANISRYVKEITGGHSSFDLCFNIPFDYVIHQSPPPSGPLETAIVGCSAYYSKIEILPSGDVFPCSYFFSVKEMKMGNIIDVPIPIIWENCNLLDNLPHGSTCDSSCIHRIWCVGCPGARIVENGRDTCAEVRDSLCSC